MKVKYGKTEKEELFEVSGLNYLFEIGLREVYKLHVRSDCH